MSEPLDQPFVAKDEMGNPLPNIALDQEHRRTVMPGDFRAKTAGHEFTTMGGGSRRI